MYRVFELLKYISKQKFRQANSSFGRRRFKVDGTSNVTRHFKGKCVYCDA